MPEPITIHADADTVAFHFGGQEPIATIEPHQLVHVTTLDCFSNLLQEEKDLPQVLENFPYLNPVTGPLFVRGAAPGDTLAVRIAALTPASAVGWSAMLPHFGALTCTAAMLNEPLPLEVWRYEIDRERGTVRFAARSSDFAVDLPWAPMLGTIGVAPVHGEVALSIKNGAHGGNLDSPMIQAGATVFLPVGQDGALLGVGDGHALQGPGELCGSGVEVPMDVTLVTEVLSGVTIDGPWVETEDVLRRIGLGRPLDDAYREAHGDLVKMITKATRIGPFDAYQLASQAGVVEVGNMVDNQYSITAGIPKRMLIEHPFAGVHERLRTIAGAR